MKGTILVTGATGNLGKCVVEAAIAKGFRVKAAARHPEKVPAELNVQPVKMDYGDPHSIDMALAGVTRVFLIAPPLDPEAPAKLKPVIEKAKSLGVEQIVFVSAMGADHNEKAPLRIVERILMDSGVNYTILRPNFFHGEFLDRVCGPHDKKSGRHFPGRGRRQDEFRFDE